MTQTPARSHLTLGAGMEFDAIRAMLRVWGAQATIAYWPLSPICEASASASACAYWSGVDWLTQTLPGNCSGNDSVGLTMWPTTSSTSKSLVAGSRAPSSTSRPAFFG